MAGEERNLKVKIDHVEKIYEGRNGKMIALNGVDFEIKETSSSVWSVLPAAVNPPC